MYMLLPEINPAHARIGRLLFIKSQLFQQQGNTAGPGPLS
jgi:hypothetical protein